MIATFAPLGGLNPEVSLNAVAATRWHRHLRTRRNNQNKSQNHHETIHSANHSSGHLPSFKQSPKFLSPHASFRPKRAARSEKPASPPQPLLSPDKLSSCHHLTGCHTPKSGAPFMAQSHRDMSGPSHEVRSVPCPFQATPRTHANFQSTANLLTPTVKWIQTLTVRRKPDCTI